MLKKLLILSLVLILAFITFACGGKKTQSSQSSSEPAIESSTPDPEPPKAPEKVERPDVVQALEQNLMDITLGNVVDLTEGEVNPFTLICGDLMLGDVAKLYISDFLFFDYYDDGQWRLSNGTVFGDVPNAIFSYEFGSGEPLALTETQLALYGNNTVLSCFSDLFAINLDNMVALNGNIGKIVNRLMDITVQELYDLTAGEYQFVIDEIKETDLEIFVGALFEILEAQLGIEVDYEVLNTLINGTVADPSIDATYLLSEILPLVVNQYVEGDIANLINYVLNHISADIEADGVVDSTIEEILAKLYDEIYTSKIAPFLAEYGEMTLEAADAELFDGMLAAILPESVVAYFDNFQVTLNDFVAEIEALIAGENQELMDVVGEIDALYSLQVLANQGVIPQEVYAIIDALIDGTMANPVLNTHLEVDALLNLLINILESYEEFICGITDGDAGLIFYYVSIAILEGLADLYYGVTIESIVTATLDLHIDDVIDALEEMTNQVIAHELIRETFDLLRGIFAGTVGKFGIDSNARADLLIDYMRELAYTIDQRYVNEATFDEMYIEYGDMPITEFIAAFYEANADVPFAEIFMSFFTPESV